jgi:hypothetical protein
MSGRENLADAGKWHYCCCQMLLIIYLLIAGFAGAVELNSFEVDSMLARYRTWLDYFRSRGLVAGAGFEPATFGL